MYYIIKSQLLFLIAFSEKLSPMSTSLRGFSFMDWPGLDSLNFYPILENYAFSDLIITEFHAGRPSYMPHLLPETLCIFSPVPSFPLSLDNCLVLVLQISVIHLCGDFLWDLTLTQPHAEGNTKICWIREYVICEGILNKTKAFPQEACSLVDSGKHK